MSYPFGAPFTWTFYPLLDDAPVEIPAQTLTLRVYSERPSREAAIAGTGAIGSPVEVITTEARRAVEFTIPKIADPDQTSETAEVLYWVSVLYKLHASGDTLLALRGLELERSTAQHSTIAISLADLAAVYPPIRKLVKQEQIPGFVDTAIEKIRSRITKDGRNWRDIWDTSKLKFSTVHMALSVALFSVVQGGGSEYRDLALEFRTTAEELLGNVLLEFGAQEPETEPTAAKRDYMIFAKG